MSIYHHTEQSDHYVRLAYQTRVRTERKAYARKAAQLMGAKTTKSVYYRAVALGALQQSVPQKTWSRNEIQIVENNAHYSTGYIQSLLKRAGYVRSQTAISIRIKRFHNGLTQSRLDAGLFSANAAAAIIGVNSKHITQWIEKGLIKAKRAGLSDNETRDKWEISSKALRQFIIENPMKINGAKADMTYLIEIVARP